MQLKIDINIIRLILGLLATALFSVAFFQFALELLRYPSPAAKKNIKNLSSAAIKKKDFLGNIVAFFSKKIAKLIRFGDFKKKRLYAQFENLNIKITPEEYYAEIITKTLLLVLFVPFGFWISSFLGVLLLLLVVLLFLSQLNKIDSIVRKKKEAIEEELPRFVSIIEQTFKNDHDVIKLISQYVENGDSPLIHELNIALADMKTGDFEIALTRLSNRVNSVYLSEVVRGLQSALHGDDTVSYFASLNSKLWDNEKMRIKKKALKTPSKVKYLTKVMLVSMFLIYIAVFGTVIYDGLSEIFELM